MNTQALRVIGLDLAGTGPSYLAVAGVLATCGWTAQAVVVGSMAVLVSAAGLKIVHDARKRAARTIAARTRRPIEWASLTLGGLYLAPLGGVVRDAPWEVATGCATLWGSVLLARGMFGDHTVLPSPLMWVLGYRASAMVTTKEGTLGIVYGKGETRKGAIDGRWVGGTTWIEEARTERAPQQQAAWGTTR